jgi:hypothetical protein
MALLLPAPQFGNGARVDGSLRIEKALEFVSIGHGGLAGSTGQKRLYVSRLSNLAAVRPSISALSSSLSEADAKMWSTGYSCQGNG